MGWFGPASQLHHTLGVLGADHDPDGTYVVAGTVAVGIGGQEVVVGDDARYFVGGEPRGLASAMNATSYGTRGITVISAGTERGPG
jgi:hypothetical protein